MPRGIYKRKKNVKYGRPLKQSSLRTAFKDLAVDPSTAPFPWNETGKGLTPEQQLKDKANRLDNERYRIELGWTEKSSDSPLRVFPGDILRKTSTINNKILIHAKLAALKSIIDEVSSHLEAL